MRHSLTIGAIVAILIAVALIFYGSASTESGQTSDSHNNEYQDNHDEYNSHDEYRENGHDYGEHIGDGTYEI